MVRTKQQGVSRFGQTNTPSISSSNYFYGPQSQQLPNSQTTSQSSQSPGSLLSSLRQARDQGLVDYSSQFLSGDSQNASTQKSVVLHRPPAQELVRIPSGKRIVLSGGAVKKRRYRPSTKALMEIRRYQKSVVNLIQRAPFLRVVKDVIRRLAPNGDYRVQSEAVSALQEASEAFLVAIFEAANMCAVHARRVTLMPRDFHLVKAILGHFNVGGV